MITSVCKLCESFRGLRTFRHLCRRRIKTLQVHASLASVADDRGRCVLILIVIFVADEALSWRRLFKLFREATKVVPSVWHSLGRWRSGRCLRWCRSIFRNLLSFCRRCVPRDSGLGRSRSKAPAAIIPVAERVACMSDHSIRRCSGWAYPVFSTFFTGAAPAEAFSAAVAGGLTMNQVVFWPAARSSLRACQSALIQRHYSDGVLHVDVF